MFIVRSWQSSSPTTVYYARLATRRWSKPSADAPIGTITTLDLSEKSIP